MLGPILPIGRLGLWAERRKSALDSAALSRIRAPAGREPQHAGKAKFLALEPTIAKAPEALAAQGGELTPTGTQAVAVLARRRRIFSILCLGTLFAMAIWLAAILAADGFGWLDGLMLLAFLVTAPWFVIGFWNSAIGFFILQF